MYALDTYDTSSQSVTVEMRSKLSGPTSAYSSPRQMTRRSSRVPGAYTSSCTASLSAFGIRLMSSCPFFEIW